MNNIGKNYMLTTMVVIPQSNEPLEDTIEKEVRKSWSSSFYSIKGWRRMKEPHLPTKGNSFWVTLYDTEPRDEIDEKPKIEKSKASKAVAMLEKKFGKK